MRTWIMIFKMWKLWPKLVSHFKYHEIREFNTSIQNKLWLKTEMIFFRFHPLELNKLNIFYKPFLRIYGSGTVIDAPILYLCIPSSCKVEL